MSMLAERKRKQKWSLNPRGKDWSEDSNKFGQKMLEKMGWQNGKGLGANENGITEHIKISYKNDSQGMGYKETNDQWTEHETNFSALLDSLTGGENKPEEHKVNSLEKKSQKSRARVHYHKFTRGKDLSRYSEKDLANIFGKKSLKETKKKETIENKEENHEKESKFIVNGGSMRDYFKKKLPSFGKVNGFVVGNNGVLKKEESESESEMRPSFGFGFQQSEKDERTYVGFGFKSEITPAPYSASIESEVNDGADAHPKITKQKSTFVSYISDNVTEKLGKKKRKSKEIIEETAVSPKKKSKKHIDTPKKKIKGNDDIYAGVTNPGFTPLGTPVVVQKHILNTINESISEDTLGSTEETNVEVKPNIREEELEKKSKAKNRSTWKEESYISPTKKKKNARCSENLDEIVFEACYNLEDKKTKKDDLIDIEETPRKKKKSKKTTNEGTENPVFNEDIDDKEKSILEENPYEVKNTEKKKKKKTEKYAIDNPNFSETSQEIIDLSGIENNVYEVTVKEKKKKKRQDQLALDNPSFNETPETSNDLAQTKENPYEVKVKESKKKRKEKIFAIDNPHFDAKDSLTDETINNAFEVQRKKSKSKKSKEASAFVNPALNIASPNNSHKDIEENMSSNSEEGDLMLNVVTTPIIKKTTNDHVTNVERSFNTSISNSLKRRKSVRFSDVTQERIIPNNEDMKNMCDNENRNELIDINNQIINTSLKDSYSFDALSVDQNQDKRGKKRKLGLDNVAFDKRKNNLEENLDSISKTLDRYQSEIENDINEKKLETFKIEDVMVGEVGNPHGENEKLREGTKLKFKYATLESRTPFYQLDKIGPKKAYKHLIKGDIVLKFKNTNLHEINGYAVKTKSTVA